MKRLFLFERKTTLFITVGVFLLLIVFVQACTVDIDEKIRFTGKIVYLNLEGGFYGIQGDDGNNYDPRNLAQEYRVDGLRVKVEAVQLPDQASIHLWGTLIEIKSIQKI